MHGDHVTLDLEIEPIPCPRPRIAVRGKRAWAYYPAKYETFKNALGALIKSKLTLPPTMLPLAVSLIISVARPKTSKLTMPKPDVDNFAKAVLDASNELIWEDDSQVQMLSVSKRWAEKGSIKMKVSLIN